jgi:hypothetical protein
MCGDTCPLPVMALIKILYGVCQPQKASAGAWSQVHGQKLIGYRYLCGSETKAFFTASKIIFCLSALKPIIGTVL